MDRVCDSPLAPHEKSKSISTMADPVSIGTGVVGVIGVALQLTVLIKDLTSSWKNYPDEVSSLLRELTNLQDVLENLEVFLMNNNGDNFKQTSALYSAAGEYVLKLEAFRHKLQRHAEGNKIRKMLERMKWPFDEKDNQKMLLELQRYTQLFSFAMSIEGCKLMSQTSSDVSKILDLLQSLSTDGARLSQQLPQLIQTVASLPDNSQEIDKIFRSIQKLESKWDVSTHLERSNRDLQTRRRREKYRQRLLERLSCIDNEKKHRRLRKIRHHGTAGSGKTILVSNIIDIITASITSDRGVAIAYYYCDYSVPNSLELSTILRAITKQLVERLPDIPEDIDEQLRQCCLADDELLTNSLFSVIELFSKVFLVIDGVDELGKEEQVATLSILKRLARGEVPTAKIFISSRREEVYITKQLHSFPRIDLSTANITVDITYFVKEVVKSKIEMGDLVIRNQALEQDIVETLVDGADGMFLWVTLQMAELCEAATDDAIRNVLQTLPRGLVATYERILDKIIVSTRGAEKATIALKMLKWIVCAKRPLRIDELKEAVGIESTHKFWDADKIPTDDDYLIRCCGNLVVFDADDRTVRLAHYTVQQFLLSESTRSERFRFRQLEAEIEVGEICVAYLSFSDFETQITKFKPKMTLPDIEVVGSSIWSQLPLPQVVTKILSHLWRHSEAKDSGHQPLQIDFFSLLQDFQRRKPPSKVMEEKYQLLSYAIDYWVFHTTRFSEKTGAWRPFRSLAMEREMQFDHRPWGESHVSAGLPYLALFRWAMDKGHVPLLRVLQRPSTGPDLSQYYNIIVKNDHSSQLLQHICRQGHESVLSLFLEVGAIDGRSLADSRLVINAIESKNKKILELLLEYGANADARDNEGCPALCIATKNFHGSAAQVLLVHGADVEATDKDGRTALHIAAERGYDAVVRLLIERGADVGSKSYYGMAALYVAAERGHEAVVRLLIEKGADVKAKDYYGRTALYVAAEGGHEAVFRLLIEEGVDTEERDDYGETTLYVAAEGGHEAVVRLLIEEGADVKAKDSYGRAALYVAAQGGHEAVVRLLIEKGADIEAKDDDYGGTALLVAAEGGHEAVVRLLIEKGADIKAKSRRGRTAFHVAAERGHEAVVQLLIEKGADVEAKGDHGRTALYMAAGGGHEVVVRLLIEKGADVGVKSDYSRRMALYVAAEGGHEAVVRLLIGKGADVKAKDSYGRTALYAAAGGGHKAVVRLLIEKGADVEVRADHNRTALYVAAEGGHEAVAQLLIERGADIKVMDSYHGRTALHVAAEGGHKAVARLLIENGVDAKAKDSCRRTALHVAAERGHEAVVRLLIEKGADVKAGVDRGEMALYIAAKGGYEEMVRLLIEKGADVEAKGDRKRTALYAAAEGGNEAVVRLLIEKGADVKARVDHKRTALHVAAERGHEVVVRLLIEMGADVKAKDDYGRTVLHAATEGGHKAVVQLLKSI